MLGLLLLALAAAGAPLDDAMLAPGEVGPECRIAATQPLTASGGPAPLRHAAAQLEQVLSCGDDLAVIDLFEAGSPVDDAVAELEQSRWGGPTPPARLHDALLRRRSVLASISGSRATAFLLQTKLQAKGFVSLGASGPDFATIEGAMGEALADRAPPLEGDAAAAPAEGAPLPASASADPIAWRSYDDGLREAAETHRPICLTFTTSWCPHCKNLHRNVLSDPRVIAKSRSFVMVEVDDDHAPALAARYAPDGRYIPRTFFLSPDGKLAPSLAARPSGRARYFYDDRDPRALLHGMDRALAKLGR